MYCNDIDVETKANCRMKIVDSDGETHLCLFAITYISAGTELRYDYGVEDAPWRQVIIELYL